ncbi:Rv3654c family TadE-like protein [Micromonospora endolithica]|uniref:Helicase n=1 Tax=Micromonospora endolithica TaxID=230091 RepID=A0A3A9ZJ52_9ACTN|nr:Rv3654c family TadE-like protein [Micromonospora endolithica]RKN48422.1 helicase [Micromonospora endolithica]TWJ24502.1 secretion/DNA translocation related TadE-like protein [Micromonospora endolithica]
MIGDASAVRHAVDRTGETSTIKKVAGDRGGASLLVLAFGLVFVLLGGFGAAIGAARLARQQASVAADLGALAGAADALRGEAAACGSAAGIASANGGRLVACQLDGLDLVVSVEVTLVPLPGLTRTAEASARAGPVRA